MAISFVAAGPVATGSNPTVSYPAGDIEGDLLVLVTTGTATPSTPSGWTQRYAQGAGRFITILTKYVEGGENNSVDLVLAGTSSKAVMLAYRGAGSYDVVGTIANGTSTSAATVSQTTTYANDFILSIYARVNTTAATFTAPASTTSRVNNAGGTTLNGLLIVDELQAAAGASAVRTATLSASVAWSAINISFVETRTLYWVGGTGTWSTTNTGNWANTSNGSPTGILPPVNTENVIIDTNSGTGTITCTAGVCNNLDVTASQAIVLGAASSTLSVYGDLTFPAGGSFSANTNANTITLRAGSAHTVTTNGKSFSSLTFNGEGGNWTLPSALTASATVTFTIGTLTLSTNNTTLTCAAFSSSTTNIRTIAFGTGNITTTGSGTAFNMSNVTSLTLTGTPTINISNNSAIATTIVSGVTGLTLARLLNFNITTGTYALTITTASSFRNLNFTGFTGSWSPSTATYTFYGDITLVAGMTFTAGTGVWTILNGSNVTAGGKTLSPITFNAAGQSLTFSAGTTTVSGTFTLTTGTLALATNGSSLSCGAFSSSGTGVRAINFGTGSITTTGSGTVWNVGTASNLTYTGTPTVNISNNSALATTISTHGLFGTEANVFDFNITTGTYTLTIPASSCFRSLNFTGFAGSYTQTSIFIFKNFTASSGMTYIGSADDLIFPATSGVNLITSAGRTLGSISQNGGSTVRLVDPTTIGSGFTYFLTNGTLDLGTNTASLTCGLFSSNNTNIRQIQFGTASITCLNWDTSNATNFTYTGTPNVNLSSGARNAQIHETGETEANVLNFNVFGTGSLTIGNGGALRSLNCTGYTGSWSPGTATYDFYGNITLVPGMTLTTGTGTWNLLATSGTQTITSGGRTMFALTQNGVGGTVSLGDALSLAGTYTLTNGTFNANNQNLTALTFSSNNTNIRTITMGSGTWSLSGTGTLIWNVSGANLTLNVNTSTIVLSDTSTTAKTFAGGGRTYNNLTLGAGAGITTYTITGANTFNTLATNKSDESTIVLPASTTTTATTFSVNGSIYKPITLTSSTSGTQATLSVSNVFTSNYVIVSDNNLTSANGTVTNGLLGANTTGWTVGAGSSFFRLLTATTQTTFTIPSNWTSANNSIHVIGGGGGGAGGSWNTANEDKSGGGGGGGGGYARISNVAYTPGNNIPYVCGAGGALGTGNLVDATDGKTSYWNLTTNTIAFVSSALSTQTTLSTTITVTRPTVSSGDLMVMIVNSSDINNTWTTPSGWTRGTDNASARAVFYKTAEPSEPASYVVTQSGSDRAAGVILVYSNATWDKNGVNTANATTVTPSAAVDLNGSAVIFCGFDNATGVSFSTPTGYTLRQSDADATAPSLTVFDILGISGSASYTAPTSTVSGGTGNARAFLVVLSPTTIAPTVSASGGGGGRSTPTTSTGGIGGTGSGGTVNNTGGTGGIGGFNTLENQDSGGGGGGGAAGPNGNGGNGGNGTSTPHAGGGGGNSGGTNGGNAVASTSSGNGGNTAGGYGGGVQPGGAGFGGGGGAGGSNGGAGSNGVDILSVALLGSGGGAGASGAANNTATAGLYGGGGGGGSGQNNNGTDGAQGAIILVWGTISPISQSNYFLLF